MPTETAIQNKHQSAIDEFMNRIQEKNSGQVNFQQAVQEVADHVIPFTEENPIYKKYKILWINDLKDNSV